MKSTIKRATPKKPATGRKKAALPRTAKAETTAAEAGSSATGETPTITIETSAITPPRSPTKSDKRKVGGVAVFLWTVGIAVTIGAGAATWPFWSPYIIRHPVASKTDQLKAAERLANLEKNAANNTRNGNVIQDLLDERKRVKDRLDNMVVNINSLDAALKSVRQMVEATIPPSSQAANANKSLQKLSDRFAKIEKSSETLGNLLQRMDMLEKNIPVPRDQPTIIDQGLSQAIDAISQRLGSLEKASIGGKSHGGSALMLAVSQLQEILHGSDPFSSQLSALVALAGDGSEIAASLNKIEPYASSGILSLNLLRSRFPDVSLYLTEPIPASSANGWLGRVEARLSSLVSLRRINGKMDALINKSENLLNDGDLAGAINAMADYSATSPKVAAWIESARQRLAAESAIAALHVFALSLIAPRKGRNQ